MPNLKNVPALGRVPAAFSVPARLCHVLSPDELTRCNLAPHAATTLHSGYQVDTDSTITWV